MHANKQEIIEQIPAGDIAACVGLKITTTGDSLSDEKHPLLLEGMHFPEPVIFMSIEPKTKLDQDKLALALKRLEEEDPTFRVRYNAETGQTVISGMGELHLEVLTERMRREFKVEAVLGKPHVAYKETISRAIEAEGKFIQQTGGHGQYGHVELLVEPGERNKGIEIIDKIRGGAIPKEFIPAVKQGILSGASSGILAGYPVVDIKVVIIDGSFHEVDSSELAFQNAAAIALSTALRKAGSVLLEPIMHMEVITPAEFMGEVLVDFNSRRGKVELLDQRANSKIIKGFVPLSEMFGYATNLRSLTQGRAFYTMEPSFYQEVPLNIAKEIISPSAGSN
jgi:elongation factor G